jgi:hypothetical protein
MGLSDRIPFRINTHLFVGFSRALGIEISENEIRVVELERRGLIRRSSARQVKLLWSDKIPLEWERSPEVIGSQLKELLEAAPSSTRRAALSLRPQAVRMVRAQVPDGVQSIREWIEDNSDKLLQLPIPLSELAYDYRAIHEGHNQGESVEIAFVRRQEIEKCLAICRLASLEPVFLGIAPDASTISMDVDAEPEYATAYRLATSALFPEERSCDFLPDPVRGEAEERFYRRLTKRVGLSAAVLLLAALLTEFLGSMYVDSRERLLNESSASNRTAVSDVAALEKEVKALEERLDAVRQGSDRTELARAMHDVACVRATGVRFRRLAIGEKKAGNLSFSITGEVVSHEQLARFLAALDTASFCQNVTLLKSGNGSESGAFERNTRAGWILFDLEGHIR